MRIITVAALAISLIAPTIAGPSGLRKLTPATLELTDQECIDLCAVQRADPAFVPVPALASMRSAVSEYIYRKSNGYLPYSPYGNVINCWNTSLVTNMNQAFYTLESFDEDIQCWDTSKVVRMDAMFQLARAFNKPLNRWNVNSVVKMEMMFQGTWAFDHPLDKWNTGNVEKMDYMFYMSSSFNSALFQDVSSVTTFRAMFKEASAFNKPLDQWSSTINKDADVCDMFTDARFDRYTPWMDDFDCLDEYEFIPVPPTTSPTAAPTPSPTQSPTAANTYTKDLELSDGNFGNDLLDKIEYAAKASAGIYWGFNMDMSITFGDHNVPDWVSPREVEDAIVLRKDNVCYAVYKGREIEDEGCSFTYDFGRCFLYGGSLGFVDTGPSAKNLMDNVDELYQKVKNSDKTETIKTRNGDETCTVNDVLIEDWKNTHLLGNSGQSGVKYMMDYHIPQCMADCMNEYGPDECFVIYTGHSQGGVAAMATALYMKDDWVHFYNPPGIVTFGQPGTFDSNGCDPLEDWIGKYIYRFVNLEKNYNENTIDNAPAVGGYHIGNTVFLSQKGDDEAAIHFVDFTDEEPDYGEVYDNLKVSRIPDTSDERKMSSSQAHDVNGGYKKKLSSLLKSGDSNRDGFDLDYICVDNNQCKSEYCENGEDDPDDRAPPYLCKEH